MSAPSAIALPCSQGRNGKPSVNMSESDRTPGNLNKSQVPPLLPRASTIS